MLGQRQGGFDPRLFKSTSKTTIFHILPHLRQQQWLASAERQDRSSKRKFTLPDYSDYIKVTFCKSIRRWLHCTWSLTIRHFVDIACLISVCRTVQTFLAALGKSLDPSLALVDEYCRERFGHNTCDARSQAFTSAGKSQLPACKGCRFCSHPSWIALQTATCCFASHYLAQAEVSPVKPHFKILK